MWQQPAVRLSKTLVRQYLLVRDKFQEQEQINLYSCTGVGAEAERSAESRVNQFSLTNSMRTCVCGVVCLEAEGSKMCRCVRIRGRRCGHQSKGEVEGYEYKA